MDVTNFSPVKNQPETTSVTTNKPSNSKNEINLLDSGSKAPPERKDERKPSSVTKAPSYGGFDIDLLDIGGGSSNGGAPSSSEKKPDSGAFSNYSNQFNTQPSSLLDEIGSP